MSFILDALKKSEAERQDQAGGEFSNVPTSAAEQRSGVWLWLLGGLLAVNLAVLVGILLRPDVREAGDERAAPERTDLFIPATQQEAAPQAAETAAPSFAERVATARQNQPARPEDSLPVAEPAAAGSEVRVPAETVREPEPAPAGMPGIDELRLNGTLQLPDLHVDIHVFSDVPAERFVFINMVKYREGSTLAEGPTVRRITPDGAILDYRGRSFLLPRE
jgi:general secretion pathway protein B